MCKKWEIEAYGALCELRLFAINGIDAEYDDFGDKYDASPEDAEPYCCANMHFFAKSPSRDVLEKYGINRREYRQICEELEKELSFGSCGWCE